LKNQNIYKGKVFYLLIIQIQKNLNGYSKYLSGETITSIENSYTEWRNRDNELKANMMYDLVKDPKENTNISKNKENLSAITIFQNLLDSVRLLD
jgi:hypothetical protein